MPVNSVNMEEFGKLTSLHYVIKSVTQNGGNLSHSSALYSDPNARDQAFSNPPSFN